MPVRSMGCDYGAQPAPTALTVGATVSWQLPLFIE